MAEPKEWLEYWRKDPIEAAVSDRLIDYAASEQFGGVQPGDTLWITGPGKATNLVTVGPLRVSDIVSQKEAQQRLATNPGKQNTTLRQHPARKLLPERFL